MKFSIHLLRYIRDIILGGGKKRIIYSIINILWIGITIACVYGIKNIDSITKNNIIAIIFLLIILIAIGIFFLINGVIGQIVLFICSFIGIFNKEERIGNLISFIIATLTLVGGVIALTLFL